MTAPLLVYWPRPARVLARGCALATLAAVALLVAPSAHAAPSYPPPSGLVVDAAEVIPAAAQQELEGRLRAYETQTTNEVAVAVVKTTGGDSIDDYANDLFERWGVGKEDKDNGVLIVVATEDRTLRIEVGRGLEGDLTDLEAGRVIREVMVPLLRAGNTTGAVTSGAGTVVTLLSGGVLPDPVVEDRRDERGGGGSLIPLFAVMGLAAAASAASRGRGGRGGRGGFGGPPIFIGGGGFGGGGFGGGGGGGGFGGFGGGGSGGGGASGGW